MSFYKLADCPVGSLFHLLHLTINWWCPTQAVIPSARLCFPRSSFCWIHMANDPIVGNVFDMSATVKVLHTICRVSMRFTCVARQLLTQLALLVAHITIAFNLTASVVAVVSCLFLVGTCSGFCNACSSLCGSYPSLIHYSLFSTGPFAGGHRETGPDRVCSHYANGPVCKWQI